MAKTDLSAIDIQRLMDAIGVEGRERESLVGLTVALQAIYESGGKPTTDEVKKLQKSMRRWLKAAKTVANVIGEGSESDSPEGDTPPGSA